MITIYFIFSLLIFSYHYCFFACRVGRTARAGKNGRSVAFVTQYDIEPYQRLETMLGQKLSEYPTDEETVLVLLERVNEAQRMAVKELRETSDLHEGKGGRHKKRKQMDGEEGMSKGSGKRHKGGPKGRK